MSRSVAVVTKVEALIARTASDAAPEARTSAFLACKLIREHGLHVVEALPRATPANDAKTTERPRLIRARFASTCCKCGDPILDNEQCAWLRGFGIWDLWCFQEVWP